MQRIGKSAKVVAAAGLLAAVLYTLLAFPGFVSDRDSTVPARIMPRGQR